MYNFVPNKFSHINLLEYTHLFLLIGISVSADITNVRSLARRNWLELGQIQYVPFEDEYDFTRDMSQLINALDLDLQWIRTFSQFRQAAQIWEESGRNDDYLWSESRLKPIRDEINKRKQLLKQIEISFIAPEQVHLLQELEKINTTHIRRQSIGQRLNRIGDLRPGIGLQNGNLDIVWCAIPSGQITIEEHIFDVAPFYMSKYLITYTQFQEFLIEKDGFTNDLWWQNMLHEFFKQKVQVQQQKYYNYPRDSVSWYQAVAFTRWLTQCFKGHSFFSENEPNTTFTVNQNLEIRLPTEWEWQHAATSGSLINQYPWGNQWDDRLANTSDSGIGRSTAVGMYPMGSTALGLQDMAGNLWEWCINDHDDMKINIGSNDHKTLRGGSFNSKPYYTDCSTRLSFTPDFRRSSFSFRIVCAAKLGLC